MDWPELPQLSKQAHEPSPSGLIATTDTTESDSRVESYHASPVQEHVEVSPPVSEDRFAVKNSSTDPAPAERLLDEFNHHLDTELSEGVHRKSLESLLTYFLNCNANEESVLHRAMQQCAIIFAKRIHDDFNEVLTQQVAIARKIPWKTQLPSEPLESKEDYTKLLSSFIGQHLGKFYKPGNEIVEAVAEAAATNVREKLEISKELLPGVAKLALYDFVFLCDNSQSMGMEEDGERIRLLQDILRRATYLATLLSPQGISIRVLNEPPGLLGLWDYLQNERQIATILNQIKYEGMTPLGSRLWDTVIRPFILDKAERGILEKPVIVVIITDGEANAEPTDELRNSIHRCNVQMRHLGYQDASVVFLIARVGNNEEARKFIEDLGKDALVGDSVYVSPDDLASKRAAFEKSGANKAYTETLVKLFLSALEVRTRSSAASFNQ
ncbi:hypothetical protein K402DRAFT_408161 [Aulographum hederae CBS 113979]|uniref:VWFA domain-containing protein n=1 Tax=Aulographum hederae CBS 113979 TaxID=1176131 RepID=A0A6G1GLX7_9PEZI|nr:hypothetical protein K402DRAFT_408161 [Aulographum hederae CBS 113979]